MMDGDRMGEKLRGGQRAGRDRYGLISQTLADFALHEAGNIVRSKGGELIYAGGDDVLALLPTSKALDCASQLRVAFAEKWRKHLPDEQPATVSAGLAVVHYKEDLRFALNAARQAEKAAKHGGRDRLQLTICRRSGEHSSVPCPWPFVEQVSLWVDAFRNGASDRWAYHLAAELPVLVAFDDAAPLAAELKRQLGRAEQQTRQLLGNRDPSAAFREYLQLLASGSGTRIGEVFGWFVKLAQSASFLARGRDA
jgi:CRISPR-associated protein Cmr2